MRHYDYGGTSTCTLAAGCLLEASKAEDAHECYRNDIRPYAPCRRISGLAVPESTCPPAIQPIASSDYLSEGIWRRASAASNDTPQDSGQNRPVELSVPASGPRDFLLRFVTLVVKMLPGTNNQTGLHQAATRPRVRTPRPKVWLIPPAYKPAPSSFAQRLATIAGLHSVIAASQTRPTHLWAARRLPFRRAPGPRRCRVHRGESDRRTPRPERWRCSARAPAHPLAAP